MTVNQQNIITYRRKKPKYTIYNLSQITKSQIRVSTEKFQIPITMKGTRVHQKLKTWLINFSIHLTGNEMTEEEDGRTEENLILNVYHFF